MLLIIPLEFWLITHEIVKEKSVEELNAQLVSLVGDDGAEMLISAFRS